MSFLTGRTPSELGIMDNNQVLGSDERTIATELADEGYRTVLVGRMHFKGYEQFHGFQERYVGDITTQWWNEKRNDLGKFAGTMQMKGCLKEYGWGETPVRDFDNAVLQKSIEILQTSDKRPLFMVVGFYGPHFPYCSTRDKYRYYLNQNFDVSDMDLNCHKEYEILQKECTKEQVKQVRSAYYGMIEELDSYIGMIHQASLKHDQDAVFIYTSDHGEQAGKRRLFGKKTLYEESIRVPLLIEDRLMNPEKYSHEVSLLNLHDAIIEYAETGRAQKIYSDTGPVIVSTLLEENDTLLQCVIHKGWKYLCTDTSEYLTYLPVDSDEQKDVADQERGITAKLRYFKEDFQHICEAMKQRQCITDPIRNRALNEHPISTARFVLPGDYKVSPEKE
jgi:choline-sulfatase